MVKNKVFCTLLLISLMSVFIYCESPTKPKRDAPMDAKGANYQVPESPLVIDPGQDAEFSNSYTITWGKTNRAKQYVIEESIDSLFVTTVIDTVAETSHNYQHYVDTLTTYYYRVQGINGEYKSDWSKTVDISVNPLETPQVTIQYSSVISGIEYSISWAAVDSAKTYRIHESTNYFFNNPIEIASDTLSYTTNHTTELSTTYYYRVQALHNDNSSTWSDVVELLVTPPLPATPVLESTVVHWNTVTIGWNSVKYATSYTIEESDNNTFSTPIVYEIENTTSKTIFFDVDKNTPMYYRIKSNGVSGSSEWSAVSACTLIPFQIFLTVSDSEVFSEEDYSLSWNDVIATSYIIEEASNSNFTDATSITVDGTIKSFNNYKESQQTLYYRVQAFDGSNTSDWSNNVTVVITPPVPDTPVLDEANVNGNQVTLNWSAVKYATSYRLEADTDSSFSNAVYEETNTLSYTFSYNIDNVTTYYYHMKALGVSGSSGWSNIVHVTIEPVTHELTMEIHPADSGTTEPTAGSHTYNENTVVTIQAVPSQGYRFVNWSGDVSDVNSDTTTVMISGDKTVKANFEEITSLTDIIMVTIPAGSFQMGDISGVGDSDELPVHTVTFDYSFEMGIYEITQGQYQTVMGTNPSYFSGNDNLPVEQVSWLDAVMFCNSLSDESGLERCYNESTWECDFTKSGFRLPTEAEWEYACRAGTETNYYTGDSISDLARAGWYDGNSENKSQPVGQKEPNAWGLYDMHGNVYEFCYFIGNYQSDPILNPLPVKSGSNRVLRGGDWSTTADQSRSSNRHGPRAKLDGNYDDVGFRIVRGAFIVDYTISGTVSGADGVTVTLSGDKSESQIVNTNGGTYSFTVARGESYTVTPSKTGYTFTPASKDFTNVTSNQTQNFIGSHEFQDITFVSIPGGQFPMGDTEGAGEADEKPVHAVTLSPFEMSAY